MKLFRGSRTQNGSKIPPHSKSVPGDKMVKGVYEDLETVKQQMAELEQQAKEAVERLHRVSGEYEQLQSAHQNLLKTAGMAWQICDVMLNKSFKSAQEAVENLRHALEGQGVEHFHPNIGDPLDDGTCHVVADIPTDKFRPGLIERIQAPGLRLADGRVIVRARVYQSVEPLPDKNSRLEETNPSSDIGAQY